MSDLFLPSSTTNVISTGEKVPGPFSPLPAKQCSKDSQSLMPLCKWPRPLRVSGATVVSDILTISVGYLNFSQGVLL